MRLDEADKKLLSLLYLALGNKVFTNVTLEGLKFLSEEHARENR